ncbi:uncharacterized protein [Neodiprion pinetum]|uniref:uncharacterized protein isoform X1 n=1 Tax=Neodiprion pinetum TaxID=441929 RepID=UPI001EE12AD7|nr:uncharacterized protein LOC124219511 isoform X1 [Neodiprion pinetum]
MSQNNNIGGIVSRIPYEIWVHIILYLNARERVSLGYSCRQFYRIVFKETKLLRDLDFSPNGYLTSALDIYSCFSRQRKKHIRKLNISNCVTVVLSNLLKTYIKSALNLVEINIQGIKFRDIQDVGTFLQPLTHLQRLSFDWPRQLGAVHYEETTAAKFLYQPFSRLRYLSIIFDNSNFSVEVVTCLQLCLELIELHLFQLSLPVYDYKGIQNLHLIPLPHLKIVEYCGYKSAEVLKIVEFFIPEPRLWTDFYMGPYDRVDGFYFEKNVLIIDKSINSEPRRIWLMTSHILLKTLLVKNFEDAPNGYCCLSGEAMKAPCLLKIDEMKSHYINLNKSGMIHEAKQQISYLNMYHPITPECDIHLVAGAFPNLTELVLCNLIKRKSVTKPNVHPQRHLKQRNASTEKVGDLMNTNLDSCFKMLVGNTPNLREFRLEAKREFICTRHYHEIWDLDSLHLISGWRNLRALCLSSIPIKDGRFLVQIGRKCTHLEKLELYNMSTTNDCCYTTELSHMVMHLQNLREFTFHEINVGKVSKVFFWLGRNPELRKVSVKSEEPPSDTLCVMTSSIEHLLYCCPKLAIFFCVFDGVHKEYSNELTHTLQRSKILFNRPKLQFQVVAGPYPQNIVYEDLSPLKFPHKLTRSVTM